MFGANNPPSTSFYQSPALCITSDKNIWQILLCRNNCWFRVAQPASMGPNQPWEPSNPEGHSWTPSLATPNPSELCLPWMHLCSIPVCARVPQKDVLMHVKWSHLSWQPPHQASENHILTVMYNLRP